MVILPGNHDPAVPDAVYRHGRLADVSNLHVLGITHDEAVLFPAFDLEIWGRAHRDYSDMIPFESGRPRSTRWQIAVAHGHYQPQPDRSTRLRPGWLIGDDEIAATGADYVALGHWNRAAQVGNGGIAAYYSGSPEYAGTINLVRFSPRGRGGGVAARARHRARAVRSRGVTGVGGPSGDASAAPLQAMLRPIRPPESRLQAARAAARAVPHGAATCRRTTSRPGGGPGPRWRSPTAPGFRESAARRLPTAGPTNSMRRRLSAA